MNTRLVIIVLCGSAIAVACGNNNPEPVDAVADTVPDGQADAVTDVSLPFDIDPDLANDIRLSDLPDPGDVPFVPTDIVNVADGPFSCNVCEHDGECPAGWACLDHDGAKRCLKPCNDGGDCDSGFHCHPWADATYCLPENIYCRPCMGDEPCGEGLCCDFISGQCLSCVSECGHCTYDFDCAPGYRCFKEVGMATGRCSLECSDGSCNFEDGYDCAARKDGVEICRLPPGYCQPCQGLCTPDFPICTIVDGRELCVQCLTNDDCDVHEAGDDCTCTGDPMYTCINQLGSVCGHSEDGCPSLCQTAGDCPPGPGDTFLSCHMPDGGDVGICYNSDGSCNDSTTCCGPNMRCYDMTVFLEMISSGTLPRLIPHPDVDRSFCECETTADCINGKNCTELSGYCNPDSYPVEFIDMMCPGGQLHQDLPPRLCGNLTEFLAGRQ